MSTPLIGKSNVPNVPAVTGEATQFEGVRGISHAAGHGGVVGINDQASNAGPGVYGIGPGTGVWGESTAPGWHGVYGRTPSQTGGAGVWGENTQNGPGVYGKSASGDGVIGESTQNEGVRGISHAAWYGGVVGVNDQANPAGGNAPGVFGTSTAGEGVHGETNSSTFAAVTGIQLNPNGMGAGVYGENRGKGPAGFFKGDVLCTGDFLLQNQDCAEEFETEQRALDPGSVVVIGEGGRIEQCRQSYDKRVAGVISGAGNLRPAIVLGRQSITSSSDRVPVALMGKVYCKVDARCSPIEVGDLLTTSSTPGHAMRAGDQARAFGAVIGKALAPLNSGMDMVPILVALQ